MARSLFLAAVLCGQAVTGVRMTANETPKGETVDDAQASALKAFIKATKHQACKDCHGYLVGNLVEGLYKSGLTQSINWAADSQTLSVALPSKAYGQIASASKLPILWVVDQEFSCTFSPDGAGGMRVDIAGLFLEPSKESADLYVAVLKEAQIGVGKGSLFKSGDPVFANYDMVAEAEKFADYCPGDGCAEYLERERLAARFYFSNHLKELTAGARKTSKVIAAIRSVGTIVNKMIGDDKWGSIFYSLLANGPKSLVSLDFTKKAEVVAVTRNHEASPSYPHTMKFNLYEKANLVGSKTLSSTPSELASTAASLAKSSWGFAMLFAHGNPAVADSVSKLPKADANHLVNLFSLCEAEGDRSGDPPCKGSTPGRIYWTLDVPPAFQ